LIRIPTNLFDLLNFVLFVLFSPFSLFYGVLNMKSFLFVATAVACVSSAASAGVIYSTGFNASEGYVVGNLNGQLGWTTYQPSAGTGSAAANITGDGRMQMNSGTSNAESARFAWNGNYGTQFDVDRAAGNTRLYTTVDMNVARAQTSIARIGVYNYDVTGTKILSGFFINVNTGIMSLVGYYNSAGTIGNYSFATTTAITFDTWTTMTTTWDSDTGRFQVFMGTAGFYVDGAGAGSTADETDFYASRNGGTIVGTALFDNLEVGTTTPAPGALALLGVAGLAGARRRRS
jgi:MYXO-CTERM domain-containing protein